MRAAAAAAAVAVVAAIAAAARSEAAAAPPGLKRRPLPYRDRPCDARGCKPSFLIIGVGKCGTSSLYYYLQAHPKVKAARAKQLQFFDHAYNAQRFATSYLKSFPSSLMPGEVTGEASPGYVQYSTVPRRVAAHLPGVRVLVIARDPADRAYSSYHYNYAPLAKKNALPFSTLVRVSASSLVPCGASTRARTRLPEPPSRRRAAPSIGRACRHTPGGAAPASG